ncbi:flagellar protein FlgN [Microbacterium bovistercoris]|uniref:Flagellar protein FlgN n=1 Tax=Microbacterium bovistercoris TaxID=2293570 RepID=A0A371NVW3_9MICO|nr:flagellar protein FlgN [Microbacterium bovistercoris]REJ06916.1 flagellar protein FlgN [Microbacterium bovistercoris]
MPDVVIDYDELYSLYTNLMAIMQEFEDASKRQRELADDIKQPYGRGELRDKAEDFEGRWDDRRNKLAEGMKGVAEQAKTILDNFQQFDEDAAAEFAKALADLESTPTPERKR